MTLCYTKDLYKMEENSQVIKHDIFMFMCASNYNYVSQLILRGPQWPSG